MTEYAPNWMHDLEPRELAQVYHAIAYDKDYRSAGVPGRNHLILIAKLTRMLDHYTGYQEDNTKDQLSAN